jgi:hypothetical protein
MELHGVRGMQSKIMKMVLKERRIQEFERRDEEDKALWRSSMGPNASGAFVVVPDQYGNGSFDNASLALAITMRLKIAIPGAAGLPNVCMCGQAMDARGYHLLKCSASCGRTRRHDHTLSSVASTCRDGSIPGDYTTAPGHFHDGRHTDLELPSTGHGGELRTLIDTVITHPWSDGVSHSSLAFNRHCATTSGFAAQRAEDAKHRKYGPYLPGNTRFFPFAIETFGHMGKDARHALSVICHECQLRRHWPKWYFYYHYVPRIALAVAVGNQMAVNAWMRRNALRLHYGRALGNAAVDDDAQLDVGPAIINPRVARRLRGSVRRIVAVDGDRREHDERRRAALGVPEEEARELDAIGEELWEDRAPDAAAGGEREARRDASPPALASGSGDEWSPPAPAPGLLVDRARAAAAADGGQAARRAVSPPAYASAPWNLVEGG